MMTMKLMQIILLIFWNTLPVFSSDSGTQTTKPASSVQLNIGEKDASIVDKPSVVPSAHSQIVFDDLIGPDWNIETLPAHVRPSHYNIELTIQLDTDNFKGHSEILIKVTEPTNYIVVNAKDLVIDSSQLSRINPKDGTSVNVPILRTFSHIASQFWILQTANKIQKGQYKLVFRFTGIIHSTEMGMYKLSYKDKQTSETKYCVVTKLEPMGARQLHPCFDNLKFKAKFSITIIHDSKYTALSNMHHISTVVHESDGKTITKFQKTPLIRPNMVGIFLSEYKHNIERMTADKKLIKFWTPNQVLKPDIVLDMTAAFLKYFQEQFKIDQPFQKIDIVALEKLEYRIVAMDNGGLITMRKTHMLTHSEELTSQQNLRATMALAHEIAHLWFKNLLSIEEYGEIPLEEALVGYFDIKATVALQGNQAALDDFILWALQDALYEDSQQHTYPVTELDNKIVVVEWRHNYIDTIHKATALVIMFERIIGEQAFMDGIRQFIELRKTGHKGYNFLEFWTEMSKSYKNADMVHVILTWTQQKGYPVVNVQTKYNDDGSVTVTMSQQRFTLNKINEADTDSPFGYMWEIPISYKEIQAEGKSELIWYRIKDGKTKKVNIPNISNFIIFNPDKIGFFRVNYGDQWDDIITKLTTDNKLISPLTMFTLLDDAFMLARAGYIKFNVPLQLTTILSNAPKDGHLPWKSVVYELLGLLTKLRYANYFSRFQDYVNDIASPVLKNIGWDDEGDFDTKQIRVMVSNLLCENHNKVCLESANSQYKLWVDGSKTNTLPPNYKNFIQSYGLTIKPVNVEKQWNDVFTEFQSLDEDSDERSDLLMTLANVPHEELLTKLLETTQQCKDFTTGIFYSVAESNIVGSEAAWKYVKKIWRCLAKESCDHVNKGKLGELLSSATQYFSQTKQLDEIKTLWNQYNGEDREDSKEIKQAIKTVQENIDWQDRFGPSIKKWLTVKGYITNPTIETIRNRRFIVVLVAFLSQFVRLFM